MGNSQGAPVSASPGDTATSCVPQIRAAAGAGTVLMPGPDCVSSLVSWFLLISQDRQHPAPALRHGQGPASSHGASGPGIKPPSPCPHHTAGTCSPGASVFVSGKTDQQHWMGRGGRGCHVLLRTPRPSVWSPSSEVLAKLEENAFSCVVGLDGWFFFHAGGTVRI